MTPNDSPVPDADSSTRRPPRLIRLARWLVLGLVLFSIGALLIGIARFPNSVPGAIASLIPNDKWTAEMTRTALDQLGWSPESLAWFTATLGWVTAAVSSVTATVTTAGKEAGSAIIVTPRNVSVTIN